MPSHQSQVDDQRTRGLDLIQNGKAESQYHDNGHPEGQSPRSESPYQDHGAYGQEYRDIIPRHDYSVSPAHPLAFISGPNRPYSLDTMLGVPFNRQAKRSRYGSLDQGGPLEDVISSGDVPMPMAEKLFSL